MPAASNKVALTDRALRAIKADGNRHNIWDSLMPGLAVRVSALGKVSFYAVRRLDPAAKNPVWAFLGRYPVMTLGAAREAAREALTALHQGTMPKVLAEARRATARAAAENTFAAVAQAFARHQLPDLKPTSRTVYELYLKKLTAALGPRPIAEIKRREIIAVIEDVRETSGKSSALGALAVARRVFNWALARDMPGLEINPVAGVRAKDLIGKTVPRTRTPSDAEVAAIWRAAEDVGAPYAQIYRLLLLTGLRLREIAEAKWDELDLEAGTLTVPISRSKNKIPLLVPLPSTAVEIFASMKRFTGPYIFTTSAGRAPVTGFSAAKERLEKAIAAHGDVVAPFVIHDSRRVVRAGLARLKVANEVAELVLGHKRKGIEGVYDTHEYFDEKRDALRRWEAHLLSIVSPPPVEGAKVVPMRARVPA